MRLYTFRYLHLYLILALFLSGCGYRLAAHPQAGSTVSIPVFNNATLRPNLETCLTSSLVGRFAGSGGMVVVGPEQAELRLAGTILSYTESAIGYTADDKMAIYRSAMSAEASLRQIRTGNVLWKGTVQAVQDFPTSSDLALKINAQDAALRELCRKLAEAIERESGNRF